MSFWKIYLYLIILSGGGVFFTSHGAQIFGADHNLIGPRIEKILAREEFQQMNLEDPSHSDSDFSEKGEIIYDDSFDDSLVEELLKEDNVINPTKKKLEEKLEKQNEKKVTAQSILGDLKKKDLRWHLTKYRIRKNDNLWSIAQKYQINYRLIIKANKLKNPDNLKPGIMVLIPNKKGIYYRVQKGDTLSEISKTYQVEMKKILVFNKIKKNFIKIGQKIFLPDVSKARYKKEESRSKAESKKTLSFNWPVRGRITSNFGNRNDPFSGKIKFHCGIDIGAKVGSPIRAAAEGKVIYSGWKGGYGKVVIIKHKKGYLSVYAHNNKNLVKKNDRVPKGKVIAYTGMTGAVTGPHLHFEIRKYLTPLNPLKILSNKW